MGLPASVRPTHYSLAILTDLESLTFKGGVIIDLEVLADNVNEIVFHSSGLELKEETFSLTSDLTPIVASLDFNSDSETVKVKLSDPLSKGFRAKLRLGYEGKLSGSMMGYYLSSESLEGTMRSYALTQFEPTAARSAFPCWDEPSFKATYSITMISRNDTIALSNMPVLSETPVTGPDSPVSLHKEFKELLGIDRACGEGGWKATTFGKTPPMSSYLVAFANGHFQYLESSYTSPLSGKTRPLRIYATSNLIHQAQFALDVKCKVLPIYETMFDIEYPLPKLDTLVAEDFNAGAMENWGLITGRTSCFLLDTQSFDIDGKKCVASSQGHECAHMWFGNIVTMRSWSSLWLKEGFATVVGEVIVLDQLFPEWRVQNDFITGSLASALALDSKRSSHAIETDSSDTNQVNQIFDDLSYSKAASVLRMLSSFVGDELFLKGISAYLKQHLYSNAGPDDLWTSISQVTGMDIRGLIHNWIYEVGFPLLTVTETTSGIHIRQDRFLSMGDVTDAENTTIWNVPLFLLSTSAEGPPVVNKSILLSAREMEVELDTSKPWKLNAGTFGVFRVAYSPDRLAKLGDEASRPGTAFGLEDIFGILSDAMSLAWARRSKTSAVLSMIERLKDQTEYLIWDAIGGRLETIESDFWEEPEEVINRIRAFRRSLFSPIVQRLGYDYAEHESPDIHQLRTLAISQCASARDLYVVEELCSRFSYATETGDHSRIPADLQKIIYGTAVIHGGEKEYNDIKKILANPTSQSTKIAAMLALNYTPNPHLLQETCQSILTEVKDQDVTIYFSGLAHQRTSRRHGAEFFKENFEKFSKRLEGNYSLGDLIKQAFGSLTSEEDAQDLEIFFREKDTSKFNMALAQTIELIRVSAKWLEYAKEDVAEWLENWEKRLNE